jgi:hypothetical protein
MENRTRMFSTAASPWYRNILLVLCLLSMSVVDAHDASTMNDNAVDDINANAAKGVLDLQATLSAIFQRQQPDTKWPHPALELLELEMMHLQEETDLSLEYLFLNGVNIQSAQEMIQNPRAGGAVAASQAVITGLALIKRTAAMESLDAFVKEIYSGGQAAYMYNLVGAYREKMDLYAELMKLRAEQSKPEAATKTGFFSRLGEYFKREE